MSETTETGAAYDTVREVWTYPAPEDSEAPAQEPGEGTRRRLERAFQSTFADGRDVGPLVATAERILATLEVEAERRGAQAGRDEAARRIRQRARALYPEDDAIQAFLDLASTLDGAS